MNCFFYWFYRSSQCWNNDKIPTYIQNISINNRIPGCTENNYSEYPDGHTDDIATDFLQKWRLVFALIEFIKNCPQFKIDAVTFLICRTFILYTKVPGTEKFVRSQRFTTGCGNETFSIRLCSTVYEKKCIKFAFNQKDRNATLTW